MVGGGEPSTPLSYDQQHQDHQNYVRRSKENLQVPATAPEQHRLPQPTSQQQQQQHPHPSSASTSSSSETSEAVSTATEGGGMRTSPPSSSSSNSVPASLASAAVLRGGRLHPAPLPPERLEVVAENGETVDASRQESLSQDSKANRQERWQALKQRMHVAFDEVRLGKMIHCLALFFLGVV